MIEDLKPYGKYKDSGQHWLGMVPNHWVIRRLRSSVLECVNGIWGADPNGTDDLVCIRVADFDRVNLRVSLKKKTLRAIPISARSRRMLKRGDLLIEKSGGGDLQPVGAVVAYDRGEPAVCSNFVARMPVGEEYNNFYVNYLHFTLYAYRVNTRSIKQTTGIQNLDGKAYLSEPVSFPPLEEQAAIVRFLDWSNGRIERAIRAKRKVIALINEQKQAIIHRAVTRGLDPSVPLKPSGIPWLGDIPAHWPIRRLKHCTTRIEQGWSPQCDAQPAADGEWGVMKVGCVNKDFFNAAQNKKLPSFLRPEPSLEIRDGDILVSRANTRELLGLAALAENPRRNLMLCDKLFRFRALPNCFNSRFLVYALRCKTSRSQIEISTNGASSSMQNIGQGVLRNLWMILPPVDEQCKIVTTIKNQTAAIDTTLQRIEREVDLMLEYRTRLVTDVVTGKLDIREAAKNLPAGSTLELPVDEADLIDESEPLEEEAAE